MKKYRKKLDTYRDVEDYVQDNLTTIRQLYIKDDLTARKVAEKLNVQYTKFFARSLFRHCGAKGKGLGGKRQGAGNKKGIRFCGECRQTLSNCICK